MALRPIIETPDPLLRQISTPVEVVDDDIRRLVSDMFNTMYAAPGIGLAAIQIAVPKRLLVIDLQEPEEEGGDPVRDRSEEHTSELQSLMRTSYAVFCLKQKNKHQIQQDDTSTKEY